MTEQMTWQKFCSKYAKEQGITYSQALCSAGDAWKEYKEKQGVTSKTVVKKAPVKRKTKEVVDPEGNEIVVKPSKKPIPKRGHRKKDSVSVRKPPKGKRIVISYITDSESESDDDCEPPPEEE